MMNDLIDQFSKIESKEKRIDSFKKSIINVSQNERRKRHLESQKTKLYDYLEQIRGLSAPDKEITNVKRPYWKRHSNEKFVNQLMIAEVMTEEPTDLYQNWFAIVCPNGTRCLIVSANNLTKVYNKNGEMIVPPFYSQLPGGGFDASHFESYYKSKPKPNIQKENSQDKSPGYIDLDNPSVSENNEILNMDLHNKAVNGFEQPTIDTTNKTNETRRVRKSKTTRVVKKNDCCILDGIYCYATKKFYILDVIAWGGQIFYDCEADFRAFWLDSKFSELFGVLNLPAPLIGNNNYNDDISLSKPNHNYNFERLPVLRAPLKAAQTIVDAIKTSKFNNLSDIKQGANGSVVITKSMIDGVLFYHKESHYEIPLMVASHYTNFNDNNGNEYSIEESCLSGSNHVSEMDYLDNVANPLVGWVTLDQIKPVLDIDIYISNNDIPM